MWGGGGAFPGRQRVVQNVFSKAGNFLSLELCLLLEGSLNFSSVVP